MNKQFKVKKCLRREETEYLGSFDTFVISYTQRTAFQNQGNLLHSLGYPKELRRRLKKL